MRKICAMGIALSVLLSTGAAVFAEGNTGTISPSGSQSIDVTAKKTAETISDAAVYSVDITWDDMTFTYSEGEKVWDPSTHTYIEKTAAGWDKTTADITVTNHSNANVDVAMAYDRIMGNGVNGALSETNAVLSAGTEGEYEAAESLVSRLTISGTPNDTVTAEGVKVGSITITVSAEE